MSCGSTTAEDDTLETTEDAALGGRLRLRQPRRGHRFGHDGVLLAAATQAAPGDHVVDLGAGVGLAGLALAVRLAGIRLTLVEIAPALAALAAGNAFRNGLSDRVRAVEMDVAGPAFAFDAAGLPPGCAQCVMMNPPFNDPQRQQRSPDAGRAAAHAAEPDTLAIWLQAAERLLAPAGVVTLIWRAEGLADVLAAAGRHFGDLRVLPVHPRPDAPAIRILLRGVKGSRAPLSLAPGLALNDPQGRPSAAAEAILREGGSLTF